MLTICYNTQQKNDHYSHLLSYNSLHHQQTKPQQLFFRIRRSSIAPNCIRIYCPQWLGHVRDNSEYKNNNENEDTSNAKININTDYMEYKIDIIININTNTNSGNTSSVANVNIIQTNNNDIENEFIHSCLTCFFNWFVNNINNINNMIYNDVNNNDIDIDISSNGNNSVNRSYTEFVQGCEIKLMGDSSFYTSDGKKQKGKMGLGSSAALTVSLIKILYKYYVCNYNYYPQLNNISKHKRIIYAISEISHFIGQGKIGSGFDIATAMFGSIIFGKIFNYQKNSKIFFQNLNLVNIKSKQASSTSASTSASTAASNNDHDDQMKTEKNTTNTICQILDAMLSQTKNKCQDDGDGNCYPSVVFPHKHLEIFMIVPNETLGSKTPQMVKKLWQWKNNALNISKSKKMFDEIEQMSLIIKSTLKLYNSKKSFSSKLIKDLKVCFTTIRQIQCDITKESNVPIVPDEIEKFLKQFEKAKDLKDIVIAGGVPGAGGYDALFLVCNKHKNGKEKIQHFCDKLDMTLLDVSCL